MELSDLPKHIPWFYGDTIPFYFLVSQYAAKWVNVLNSTCEPTWETGTGTIVKPPFIHGGTPVRWHAWLCMKACLCIFSCWLLCWRRAKCWQDFGTVVSMPITTFSTYKCLPFLTCLKAERYQVWSCCWLTVTKVWAPIAQGQEVWGWSLPSRERRQT